MNKKLFTFSNILTALFIIFIFVLLVSPNAKARVIEGLMSIGLFQPDIPGENELQDMSNGLSGKDVYFSDINGNNLNIADQKGKVVFINFWATWCPPCIAEMPSIQKLYDQFKEDGRVVFLMVDVENDEKKAQAFLKKNGYDLPLYSMNSVPPEYYSGNLPTTVILDKRGRISYNHKGAADYSNPKVAQFIAELLKQ